MSTKKKRGSFQNYKVKLRLIDERGYVCQKCGKVPGPGRLQLDHIQELWDGGGHEDSNLQLLCYECHKIKSASEHRRWSKKNQQVIIKDGVRVPTKGNW
jgi:5-methylcytosine-specific restriction protein A